MAFTALGSAEALSANGSTAVFAAQNMTGAKLITVSISTDAGVSSAPSVTDDSGNTYTARTVTTQGATDLWHLDCVNPTVDASVAVTVNAGASSFPAAFMQWFGADGTVSFEAESAGAGVNNNTTFQVGSITPGGDGRLFVTGMSSDTATETAYAINSSFTKTQEALELANSYGGAAAYLIQTTGAAVNPAWSSTGGTPQTMCGRMWTYVDSGGAAASAAITGTAGDGCAEADIVAGGQTVIITLTNDTWVASGATFDAIRQDIIDGLDSAQSESNGWNAEVRDNEVVGAVVRTSDTVVTITLTAAASYQITANETIAVTVPATAVTGGSPITATPTFTVTATVAAGPKLLGILGIGA